MCALADRMLFQAGVKARIERRPWNCAIAGFAAFAFSLLAFLPINVAATEESPNATLSRIQNVLRSSADLQFKASITVSDSTRRELTQASANFYTRQPNKFRVELTTGRTLYQIISDGNQITIFRPGIGKYTQLPAQNSIISGMYMGTTLINVAGRMLDFFWTIRYEKNVEIERLNRTTLNGQTCDGLRIRRYEEIFEIWYSTSGDPLPCKLISRRTDGSALTVNTSIFRWTERPSLTDELFQFTSLKGNRPVDSLELMH